MNIWPEHELDVTNASVQELVEILQGRHEEEKTDNSTYMNLAQAFENIDSQVSAILQDIAEDEERHSQLVLKLAEKVKTSPYYEEESEDKEEYTSPQDLEGYMYKGFYIYADEEGFNVEGNGHTWGVFETPQDCENFIDEGDNVL